MITFGFTIYKFFQFELQGRLPMDNSVLGPRGFALIMIAIGVLALLVAMIQHGHSLRRCARNTVMSCRSRWRRSWPVSLRCWG